MGGGKNAKSSCLGDGEISDLYSGTGGFESSPLCRGRSGWVAANSSYHIGRSATEGRKILNVKKAASPPWITDPSEIFERQFERLKNVHITMMMMMMMTTTTTTTTTVTTKTT
jgi:hypothetical protein